MYTLSLIPSQRLDEFYASYAEEKTFLQTSQYGQYRQGMGEQIFYLGIFHDAAIVGIALVQKITARRGRFLHVPHGPLILENHKTTGLPFFLQQVIALGHCEQCDFVRISPLLPDSDKKIFQEQLFISSPVHLVNPEKTWVLPIQIPEETILEQMKKTTRYEVRRIEKSGITVRMGNTPEDLNIFWKLHEETVRRHGFVPFSRKSTEIELAVFGTGCQIFSAAIDGEYLSSSVILYDAHAGYYHQGASIPSKFPVAYATLWAAIREAKRRGCREFNFWGVCAEDQKSHPWYGLSYFKRGFGGEERNFLHAQDHPLTWKYHMSSAVERWRKWRRGY